MPVDFPTEDEEAAYGRYAGAPSQADLERVFLLDKGFAAVEAELRAWVAARSWTSGDGPKAIFIDAVGWLRERDVLLPGVTTLARLVVQVRDDTTR
ncbi:hypothetical protein FHR32_008510 [Streptosporangium album]|uniref:DUF4158 domain-containing protein n=1 Tax=Streptosporangium album TaxID=47479 RepID=A0A7W7S5Z8_9ACTN|nr:DUF4158 domain-containing protein [Streptosporangium album]MBB4944107.1 hypothetical protein [Streptosporangium album]